MGNVLALNLFQFIDCIYTAEVAEQNRKVHFKHEKSFSILSKAYTSFKIEHIKQTNRIARDLKEQYAK